MECLNVIGKNKQNKFNARKKKDDVIYRLLSFFLATVYGNGVYFARDASYSTQKTYSPPDGTGNRYMYLARVLAGEYTTGRQGMITPPPKGSDARTQPYSLCSTITSVIQIILLLLNEKKKIVKGLWITSIVPFLWRYRVHFFNFEIASMGETGRRFIKLKPPM